MCKSIFSVVGIAVIAALFFVGCGKKQTNINENMSELPLDPDKIPFGEDAQKVRDVYGLKTLDCARFCEDTMGEYNTKCEDTKCEEFETVKIGGLEISFSFENHKLSRVDVEYANCCDNKYNSSMRGDSVAVETILKKLDILQKKVKQVCNSRRIVKWSTEDFEGESWNSYVWRYNKNLYIQLSTEGLPLKILWDDAFDSVEYRRWSECLDSTGEYNKCEGRDTWLDSVKNVWLDSVGGVRCDSNTMVAYAGNGTVVGNCYREGGEINKIQITYYVEEGGSETGYDSIKWGASVDDVKRIYSTPELKDMTDSINSSIGVREFMQEFIGVNEFLRDLYLSNEWKIDEEVEEELRYQEYRHFYFYNNKLCATERRGGGGNSYRYCDPEIAARVRVTGCDKFEDAKAKNRYK